MTTNVGNADRMIRFLLGLALIAAPLMNMPAVWSDPVWAYAAMAVGLVLAGTALLKFCPLYRVLGLSTCKST